MFKLKSFKITRRRVIVLGIIVVVIILFNFLSRRNGNGVVESEVMRGEVREELVLTGEINAREYSNLQFNTSGTLSWIGVSVGDHVKSGQALAKLDTTILNSAYQRALADLRSAEATVNRVHDDLKGKDSTETFSEKETRVAAEAAHDKAYDAYVSAEKALRDSTLIAPFSGIVTYMAQESAGMNVTAGVVQVTLVNPETLYFEVNADQTEVSRFRIGDQAQITLDAFEDSQVLAEITSVSLTPNPTESGTVYPIRMKFLNIDNFTALQKYRIAMTGDVLFVLSKKEDVLFVEPRFINSDKEGKYLLVNEGKDKKYVEVGVEGDDRVEVSGDINEGVKILD